MSELATQSTQDYLKVIFELCRADARASTGQIAERLDVTPASVTGMLKKLAESDPPLLEYRRHRGAVLTEAGERMALETIRRHRLLELFLHEALDYGWDEVHDEADRLEHAISDALGERIARWLRDPAHDPHGDPIPSRDLQLPESDTMPLDEVEPGQDAVISRVHDRDPELLRYVEELSLTPSVAIKVLAPLPFSDHVRVQRAEDGEAVDISAAVAQHIHVRLPQDGQVAP
ncbi:MAG: metal-dependent transcriptional regulator [Chloroflexota bacterium]